MGALFFCSISSFILPNFGFAQCEGVKATTNFAIPPYTMWHYSQLRDFPVYQEVEVDPSCGPVQYTIAFQIWREGGDTIISIPDLESLGTPYCVSFPDNTLLGNYAGRYRVTSDLTGDDLSDNEQMFQFTITKDRFAREIHNGPFITADLTEEGHVFGAYYSIRKAPDLPDWYQSIFCVEVGMANPEDFQPSVLGQQGAIIVYMYEWHDLDNDGLWIWSDETTIAGFGQYDFEEGEQPNSLIRVPLYDEDLEEGVFLDHDAVYFVAVQINKGMNTVQVPRMMYSVEHDYTLNTEWNHFQPYGDIGLTCSAGMGHFHTGPFGEWESLAELPVDTVPVLRPLFTCYPTSNVEEVRTPSSSFLVSNVVNDRIVARIDPASNHGMSFMIVRMDGAIVHRQKIDSNDGALLEIPVTNLSPGAYFVTFSDRYGVLTEKLFIQR